MSDSEQADRGLDARFNLEEVIGGLAIDMQNLRDGKISIEQARASAALAKQMFNGVRLVVNAQKYLEGRMIPLPPSEPTKTE